MNTSGLDLRAAATRVSQSMTPQSAAATKAAATKAAATKAQAATGSTASTTSTTGAGDITSNDFLSLLVTEMKNQDPTQPTDPNAYIQQLVSVNSLQQLIGINQELGGSTATSGDAKTGAISAMGLSSPSASSATNAATTAANAAAANAAAAAALNKNS